jgi:hypothetical protein
LNKKVFAITASRMPMVLTVEELRDYFFSALGKILGYTGRRGMVK